MPVVVNDVAGSWRAPVTIHHGGAGGGAPWVIGGGGGGSANSVFEGQSVTICVQERTEPVAVWPPVLSRYQEHRRNWIATGDLGELLDMISEVGTEFPLDPG